MNEDCLGAGSGAVDLGAVTGFFPKLTKRRCADACRPAVKASFRLGPKPKSDGEIGSSRAANAFAPRLSEH
jgi:hypothetical protein